MSDKDFIEIVISSPSMMKASEKLNIPYSTFIRRAKKLGVYYPNQYGKHINKTPYFLYNNLYDFITNKKKVKSLQLKKHLFRFNIFEDKCHICGFSDKRNIRDEYSVCELHHIDGNSDNNRLTNLCILCPNHHALTKNFRNSNHIIKDDEFKYYNIIDEYTEISFLEYLNLKIYEYEYLKNKNSSRRVYSNKKNDDKISYNYSSYCKKCNMLINRKDKNGMCKYCNSNIDFNEIYELVIMNGFTKVSKDFKDVLNLSASGLKSRLKSLGFDLGDDFKFKCDYYRYKNTNTGLKSVILEKKKNSDVKYLVSVTYNKKNYYCGRYITREEAAKVADEKMVELFGPDVLTNKKLGLIDY